MLLSQLKFLLLWNWALLGLVCESRNWDIGNLCCAIAHIGLELWTIEMTRWLHHLSSFGCALDWKTNITKVPSSLAAFFNYYMVFSCQHGILALKISDELYSWWFLQVMLMVQIGKDWDKYFISRKQFATHGYIGGIFVSFVYNRTLN